MDSTQQLPKILIEPKQVRQPAAPGFTYWNSRYDSATDTRIPYENTNKQYRSITFNISRYGKYQKTIKFGKQVTEQEAVRAAEKYLSVAVSNIYYKKIRDDSFIESNTFKEFNQHYKTRGDCLSDARMLEQIDQLNGTALVIHCGS